MAPRKRLAKNSGLEPNLYAQKKNGKVYYSYKNPATGKYTGFGSDKAKANRAAKILNARFALSMDAQVNQLVAQAEGKRDRLAAFIETFIAETLPGLTHRDGSPYSQKTLKEYERIYKTAAHKLGHLKWDEVSRKHIAEYLSAFPNTSSNRHRARLRLLFKHAIAQGMINENPVDGTIEKTEQVKRRRLTLELFNAVYNHENAPQWLRNAMDVSLHTLLRREDVVALMWEQNVKGDVIEVQHEKTKRFASSKIRIRVRPPLRKILDRCRDGIESPFVIHRIPEKMRPEYVRIHYTEVKEDMVTKTFQKVRDTIPEFQAMPKEERPGFGEIRSLGRKLYENTDVDVKTLGGWSDEKMPAKYLEGHEVWIEAEAGLALH